MNRYGCLSGACLKIGYPAPLSLFTRSSSPKARNSTYLQENMTSDWWNHDGSFLWLFVCHVSPRLFRSPSLNILSFIIPWIRGLLGEPLCAINHRDLCCASFLSLTLLSLFAPSSPPQTRCHWPLQFVHHLFSALWRRSEKPTTGTIIIPHLNNDNGRGKQHKR